MDEQFLLRLHEGMMILYALSVFFYFLDYLFQSRRANRIAFLLLLSVWLTQTFLLAVYMYELGRFPVLTIYEGLYFYVWVLITLSLLVNRFLKIAFIVFFTNVLGFAVIVIFSGAPFHWSSDVMAGNLASELLFLHITLSLMAYGAFSLSSMFSILYTFQYQLLKRKIWQKRMWRLGDLDRLEKLSCTFDLIGLPMLLAGVILGMQWAFIKIPGIALYDWKIIGSFLIIFLYGWMLYQKVRNQLGGIRFAYWNATAFLAVLVNFFLLGQFSSFHFWYA